ncbi:MAG TPA: VOC family protein [Nitrososphaera sp.]|nr:VOC family protein [Nitrososphaera sp.]
MSKAMNHVAISVTDIHQAMHWYNEILGMTILSKPIEIPTNTSKPQDKELFDRVRTVFGPRFGKLLICHLSSANGVGIELFQFVEPKAELRKDNFEYWKTGFFHIAITDQHLDELADRIASSGGKKRTEVMELSPGSGRKICFCEDPFGNIIEIYSHSYEQFWSNIQL